MKAHPKNRVKQPLAHKMAKAPMPDPAEAGEDPAEEAGEGAAEESGEKDPGGTLTGGAASIADAEKGHAPGGFFKKIIKKKR